MKRKSFLAYNLVLLSFMFFVCLSCKGDVIAQDKKPKIASIKTVLILGNSIVQHSPKPEIGWYGNWGMAASVKDSDFVHLLVHDFNLENPSIVVKFKNIADFEKDFDTYSFASLDSLRNPDMLILKISENVDEKKAVEDNFIFWYDRLIKYIAPEKTSLKVIVNGFWDKKIVNGMVEKYAFDNHYPFVTLSDLSKDSTNTAKGKFTNMGVAAHPSDKGMRMIELRIWTGIMTYFKK